MSKLIAYLQQEIHAQECRLSENPQARRYDSGRAHLSRKRRSTHVKRLRLYYLELVWIFFNRIVVHDKRSDIVLAKSDNRFKVRNITLYFTWSGLHDGTGWYDNVAKNFHFHNKFLFDKVTVCDSELSSDQGLD